MIQESIESETVKPVYSPTGTITDNWNLTGLRDYYAGWLTKDEDFRYTAQRAGRISSPRTSSTPSDRPGDGDLRR